VLVVREEFIGAEHAAAQEAGAVATLDGLPNGIGGEAGNALRDRLTGYVQAAVEEGWPRWALEHRTYLQFSGQIGLASGYSSDPGPAARECSGAA
jgi:hypothetical protein